jgi:hypothetical protein
MPLTDVLASGLEEHRIPPTRAKQTARQPRAAMPKAKPTAGKKKVDVSVNTAKVTPRSTHTHAAPTHVSPSVTFAPPTTLAEWNRLPAVTRANLLQEYTKSGHYPSFFYHGGGFHPLAILHKYVTAPLEEGLPIVAPYVAFVVVTTLCPECTAAAALAAGGASFLANRFVARRSDSAALFYAALDATGEVAAEVGGERAAEIAQRALIRSVDRALVQGDTEEARNILLTALMRDRTYDPAAAFRHR